MPSHNRITVNLPSRSLYSELKKLAQKKELTLSGLIQKIVIASLRSDVTDTLFLEELRADISPQSAEKKDLNLTRILHRTVSMPKEKNTSDNLVTLYAKSFVLGNYQYEAPVLKFERYNRLKPLSGKISNELIGLVRDALREYVVSKIPNIIGQLGCTPDILHLFVKKTVVKYYRDGDVSWHFNILPELHALPLFINDAMNSRLDFLQIRFKQFKDVAVNGWDKSKYERLILIDNASTSRSGGYFIGASLYKLDYMTDEYKDFHFISIGNDTELKSVNCMVHIHHRDVKFKRISKHFSL